MTDDDNDKTEEVREQLGEDGAVGGETDSDSGAVLTLDGDSPTPDGAGEGEGDERGDDGGN
jgi:hypothetical protein